MPRVYGKLNSCRCAIGEEYLYHLLRNPSSSKEELEERERVITHLLNDDKKRTDLSVKLLKIGNLKNISAYEYMNRLKDMEADSSLIHIFQACLLLAAIGSIFFIPVWGVFLTIIMFFVNVITYFRRKSQVEGYFTIVFFILRMLEQAKELKNTEDSELKDYFDRIVSRSESFNRMKRNSFFIMSGAGAGPLELILDYLKMAFHIDLIKFNTMLKEFSKHVDEFEEIFETVGFLDCMLAFASYRKLNEGRYSIPVFTDNTGSLDATGLAHPLLNDPVTNDLHTSRSILLTGSNASGKSTFLKTVALNAIMAQSIHTVLAEHYEAGMFRVMTSMALRDDIESGESYYIVEIKSLKRIIDAAQKKDVSETPVLCFIDEVLRGTNTVERIAASTRILHGLSNSNALCIAATHDIELTHLLEEDFENYHFEEQIMDNEIRFDYRLKPGRATSRNAISLLKIMGYPQETVDAAVNMAERYVKTGEWSVN
ncbi:MAG: hypothetical protein J6Y89_01955 [Lachnospiraceae bacterium]|nr:hypothetical protein [Lachnospiraceae bacterium]